MKVAQPACMKSGAELTVIVTYDKVRSGEFEDDRGKGKRKVEEGRKHVAYAAEGSDRKRNRKDQRARGTGRKPRVFQGASPMCNRCNQRHHGECRANVCFNCKKPGHSYRECRAPRSRLCFECGAVDCYRNNCPRIARKDAERAKTRAFVMDRPNARKEGDVVTGTFLINNRYATM